ncbi:MAG: calcium/sodium antiporter [Acidimicrobiia bacterium]|nr:calcium/sodium antiporter [Acidimicrobiia bacterium]
MLLAIGAALVGLALLIWAADLFVDGAVALAGALDVSPVVIGAVIVGFGTSVPELLVSGLAATQDDRALGVGNIVGSNVANLSLVLASAGLVTLIVAGAATRRELPLSVIATAGFALTVVDGEITRLEGVALLVGLIVVLAIIIGTSRPADPDLFGPTGELKLASTSVPRELSRTVGGLALTALAAQLVVWGAGNVADELGLSGGFIGFSLVAIGTSLPELVTAITAARRGETELVVGNLLGSNIFNSLAVGSVIALAGPGPIGDDVLTGFGVGVMMVVTIAAAAFLYFGGVARVRSIILLGLWVLALVGLSTSEGQSDDVAGAHAQASASIISGP